MSQEYTVPGKHHNDGPPRLNSKHCGNHHIAASRFSQSPGKRNLYNHQGEKMNAVAIHQPYTIAQQSEEYFTTKQIEILKNSICKGVSDDEFQVFLMACQKTNLDPFMRQIYAVKRKSKKPDGSWGETMTIQTGIDGYRLIAERTERYAPGPEPTYNYDVNGALVSATTYIKKLTKDGTWHTVSASAYLDEYMQTYQDKSGEKKPMGMWATMQRTMLAKCAEAQALRKAFPAEMSGLYTKEEMEQADVEEIIPKITEDQAFEMEMILGECETWYVDWFYENISKQYKAKKLEDVPADVYEKMKESAAANMNLNHEKQRRQELLDSRKEGQLDLLAVEA